MSVRDPAAIIGPVCRAYGVSPDAILGKSRSEPVATARAVAIRNLAFHGADLDQISMIFSLSKPGACRAIQRAKKRPASACALSDMASASVDECPQDEDEYRIAWERLRKTERDQDLGEGDPEDPSQICAMSRAKIEAVFADRTSATTGRIARLAKLKPDHVDFIMLKMVRCGLARYSEGPGHREWRLLERKQEAAE